MAEDLPIDGKNITSIPLRTTQVTPGTDCIVSGWGAEMEVRFFITLIYTILFFNITKLILK